MPGTPWQDLASSWNFPDDHLDPRASQPDMHGGHDQTIRLAEEVPPGALTRFSHPQKGIFAFPGNCCEIASCMITSLCVEGENLYHHTARRIRIQWTFVTCSPDNRFVRRRGLSKVLKVERRDHRSGGLSYRIFSHAAGRFFSSSVLHITARCPYGTVYWMTSCGRSAAAASPLRNWATSMPISSLSSSSKRSRNCVTPATSI